MNAAEVAAAVLQLAIILTDGGDQYDSGWAVVRKYIQPCDTIIGHKIGGQNGRVPAKCGQNCEAATNFFPAKKNECT
jgi:hypothetical protein